MFCKYCGKQIPDGSMVCPFCGSQLRTSGQSYTGGYQGQYGMTSAKKIDNIFSALVHEKTKGAIWEFSLWCTVCLVVLLSIIATALSGGKAVWILMLFFSIGMGVIMAFRLKPIAMLYSVGGIQLILGIVHYASFIYSVSAITVILFILILLATITLAVFGILQFFTKFNFGTVCTILSISISGTSLLMHICMYACAKTGILARYGMGEQYYWLGTISLWLLYAVGSVLFALFFWGCIDSRKSKIINNMAVGGNAGYASIGSVRCVAGMYQGRVFFLNGGTITIGSQAGANIVITDPMISPRHCIIRFNMATGYYEVYDDSQNGVYVNDGSRLQRGVYNAVLRGKVIYFGNGGTQQFQLM